MFQNAAGSRDLSAKSMTGAIIVLFFVPLLVRHKELGMSKMCRQEGGLGQVSYKQHLICWEVQAVHQP